MALIAPLTKSLYYLLMSIDGAQEQEPSPRPITIQDVHDALSHGMGMGADGGGWHHQVDPNNLYRKWLVHSVTAERSDSNIGAFVRYIPPTGVLRPARGLFGGEIAPPPHMPLFGEGSLSVDLPTQTLIASLQSLATARQGEGFTEDTVPNDGGPSWANRTGTYSRASFMFPHIRDLADRQRPIRLVLEGQLDTLEGSNNWPFVAVFANLSYADLLHVLEQSEFFKFEQRPGVLESVRRTLGAAANTLRNFRNKP